MKQRIKMIEKNRISQRVISIIIVMAMFLGFLPIEGIKDGLDSLEPFSFTLVHAAGNEPTDDDETDPDFQGVVDADGYRKISIFPSQLVEYSKHCVQYHKYHQKDWLTITTKGNENLQYFTYGFQGIGSEKYPFEGKIKIGSGQQLMVLNLDAPLFNCVYDSVTLDNNEGNFLISRDYDDQRTEISGANDKLPLLAKSVRHNNKEGATPATWNIEVVKPTAGTLPYLGKFGGFIGTMVKNSDGAASLTVNITMNTVSGDTGDITIAGMTDDNADLGLVCNTMEEDTSLTFSLTGTRKINSISSTKGNVGGLVGRMENGSKLYYTGTNIQNSNTDIKTTAAGKYAGGIVGYNNGGTVKITLPAGITSYPVNQKIEGTAGAGGVYGYYSAGSDSTGNNEVNTLNNTFDTSKVSVNCQVNGGGYTGGLFGEFDCEHDYSITNTATITSNHYSGSAEGYGGLIGRYNNTLLSKKLDIGGVTAVSTRNSNATYYGGAIAFVGTGITEETGETDGGISYIKFNGFIANCTSADQKTFGGIAARADNAFIDANNVTISVSGDHKFKGGAVVGRMKSGVLRMTETTDLTNTLADEASYSAGQIVGYRDSALIFGGDGWILKRGSAASVDDIGSWGEVVRFNTKNTATANHTKYGYGADATVIDVNESDHYVTVSSPTVSNNTVTVSNEADFVRTALNIQLAPADNTNGVLRRQDNSTDYSSQNITLTANINLSGTGISSFTRDNAETDSISAAGCVYTGNFDGGNNTVTLAAGEPYGNIGNAAITSHSREGCGKIYNHKYIGLFGITNTSSGYTAKDVTFNGKVFVKVFKDNYAYIGSVAGRAAGYFSVDGIKMTDAVTGGVHETEFKVEGVGTANVGGIVGETDGTGINVINCNIKCNINSVSTNSSSQYGGIIGFINYNGNETRNWSFETVTVSGNISNTSPIKENRMGGLVAVISETKDVVQSQRNMSLTDITVSGLSISGKAYQNNFSKEEKYNSGIGGMLGYEWLNVNPTFHNVIVNNNCSVTLTDAQSGYGDLAGLVYRGTGHWVVETSLKTVNSATTYYDGININGLTVSSTPNAKSFGMIVNKGMSDNTAIFLDICADDTTNSTKSYRITSADFSSLASGCVFDELVAYSALPDSNKSTVLNNGKGVVSIHSDDFVTDGINSSETYKAQTSRGAVPNEHTRYYYNLDTIKTATGASDYLMRWALNLYAHKSLRNYFELGGGFSIDRDAADAVTTVFIPDGTYDMKNYSWYPVNMAGVATVNGTFKFYNKEFEDSEQLKYNVETNKYKRTSLYDYTADKMTQHHLMHCALFNNVTGGITIGSSGVTLQGNVGQVKIQKTRSDNTTYFDYSSGALVCGTLYGSSTISIASFTTNGNINLDGIKVNYDNGTYAPLMINKIGGYSTVVVKNVKAKTSTSYSNDQKAASSLIGDVGSSTATNINLTFADIQIDGRTTSDAYSLNGVYNTTSSLFYRATLLNTFRYSSGSGVYDFNSTDDWTRSGSEGSYTYSAPHIPGVTYGSEIDDADSQHLGKEYWYKDTNGGIYTNYNTPGASGTTAPSPAISFSGFLPYVYSKCTASDIGSAADKKYQLKINWADTFMTGCGTYNDPYIITKGSDLENISNILSGTHNASVTVTLPSLNSGNTTWNATQLKQKKWDNYGDAVYTYNGSTYYYCTGTSGYKVEDVQNYLAGAYYKILPGATINLTNNYTGLRGDKEDSTFRGVIVGNGETITLTGDNPLIYQSNGSVVKGLNIVVNKAEIDINQTDSKQFSYGTSNCKAYGAVIGKIMGGDNIIDNVTVSFGNSKVKLRGNYAQTVPVGGYVGVVVKGSLIFRGMEDYRANESLWSSISGLGTTTVKDNSGNTNLLYTDAENKTPNMKWLYVNPIVGRVINAAVFTEGDAYRPFENGTREGVYIKTNASEADPEDADNYTFIAVDTTYEKYSQPVTMQNGTKNYSIADITENLDTFLLNNIPERTSGWAGSADFRRFLKIDLNIPNAQSLFIMSLVTQAGLGGTNYLERSDRGNKETSNTTYYPATYAKPVGGFINLGNWGIAPYYKYRATHVAEYTYVGKTIGSLGAPGTAEPTAVSDSDSNDEKAFKKDYEKAKTDNAQFNRGAEKSRAVSIGTIPYIIGKYTPKIDSNTTGYTPNAYDSNYFNNINGKDLGYVAFCLTHQYSYLNLTFSATDSIYYMPDGFRGLGCLGYTNFIGGANDWTETYQDIIVHLFGIEGNGNTVDLNMSLYNYYQINSNYDAYAVNNACPGFGFIDAMMQNKTCAVGTAVGGRYDSIDVTDNDYQIRNLTLTGVVKSVVINASSGNDYPMNSNINSNYFVAVGGLVGNVVYRSSNDDIFKVAISDINLSNLKVNGVRNTGGLMGNNQSENNADSKTTITNITTSDLEVSSGIYTGGLIGCSTQTALDISNVTIAEPNIKSYLNFAGGSYGDNATGGIIGFASTESANGPVYVHDVTIGTAKNDIEDESDYSAYIGYDTSISNTKAVNETIRTGGIIGQVKTLSTDMIESTGEDHIDYNTIIEKCKVLNVDLYGHKVGGVVGACEKQEVFLGIFDTVVMTDTDTKAVINGHSLDNTTSGDKRMFRGAGGIFGCSQNLYNRFTVQNCLVEGYTIENYRDAGAIAGNLDCVSDSKDYYDAKICDTKIKNVRIVSNERCGGIVGYLYKNLSGYNILTDNIQFKDYSSALSDYGHIVGKNNSKAIKIAGFARKNMGRTSAAGYTQREQMIGNYADNNTSRYGSGGYVIFADYYDTYADDPATNIIGSTVNNGANIAVNSYSIETETDVDNNYPYVTVRPSLNIEAVASPRFLTGDAVPELTYNRSVFKRILDNKTNSVAGAYQNIPALTSDDISEIRTQFQTSSNQGITTNAPNIPLLVIEDTDYQKVSTMINNYLHVLTNTDSNEIDNFAQDVSGFYQISLNQCTYNNGAYTIAGNGTACLKRNEINNNWYFRMTASSVDNENENVFQFSLLDVQFFDPTDATKIAYHLYVPCYVKKLLQFNFAAAMISNTEYFTSAYHDRNGDPLNGNSLFENLGNPVTLKFEYTYSRNATEWKDTINGGENVLSNLYKTLSVISTGWPEGTKMVLVDANNKDKYYYLDAPPVGETLALHDFVDSDGNNYDPAPINNLMNIEISNNAPVRTLTLVDMSGMSEGADELAYALTQGATVCSGGTYYRPITDSDTGLTDEEKYGVTSVSDIQPERYYLSIFTPESDDTTTYHFQITSSDSFNRIAVAEGDPENKNIGWCPNHVTATNAVVHLYTGDLYENDFSMTVTSRTADRELNAKSNGYSYIKVNMISTIKLKSVASEVEDNVDPSSSQYDRTRKGIASNMLSNIDTSEIYQAFLSTYDRKDTDDGVSNISINMGAPPVVIIKEYNYYEGTTTSGTKHIIADYPNPNNNVTENYVLLANNKNIISQLGNESNNYAITFELEYELNYYDEASLYAQFPSNPNKSDEIGTKVIGYSNISSSENNVAYSATSEKIDDRSPRYYAAGTSSATLSYNVIKTNNNMLGPYSYLGINSLETDETEHYISTQALYDVSSLKDNREYIDLTLKLFCKNDSGEYDESPLVLENYVKNLKIYGADNEVIFDSDWNNGYTISEGAPPASYLKITKTANEYKLRVHKDHVEKQGDAESGRFLFRIDYTVYTGDSKFKLDGFTYSNYKVFLHANLSSAIDGVPDSGASSADNYLIYTNAHIEPNVIK